MQARNTSLSHLQNFNSENSTYVEVKRPTVEAKALDQYLMALGEPKNNEEAENKKNLKRPVDDNSYILSKRVKKENISPEGKEEKTDTVEAISTFKVPSTAVCARPAPPATPRKSLVPPAAPRKERAPGLRLQSFALPAENSSSAEQRLNQGVVMPSNTTRIRPLALPTLGDEAALTAFTTPQRNTRSTREVPPTPIKVARSSRARPAAQQPAQACPYRTLHEEATAGTVTLSNATYCVTQFARGTYTTAYKSDELPGRLIKVYHNLEIVKKLPLYLQNSLNNYAAAQNIGIDVAKIYNLNTAKKDSCLVVELIPEALDWQNPVHLEQAIDYFRKSFKNQVAFDLSRENLRLLNGKLKLIDFGEKTIDFNKKDSLGMFVIQFLKSWCRGVVNTCNDNGNAADAQAIATNLLQKLTYGLDEYGFKQEWITEAIQGIGITFMIQSNK